MRFFLVAVMFFGVAFWTLETALRDIDRHIGELQQQRIVGNLARVAIWRILIAKLFQTGNK